MQSYFGEDNLDLQLTGTHKFVFSSKPIKRVIEDIKHLKGDFGFSELDSAHEHKKCICKSEIGNNSRVRFRWSILLWSKPYSINKKPTEFNSKHRGMLEHHKYTIEDCKYCSEKHEKSYVNKNSFRSNKHEVSIVKQPKLASKILVDKFVILINIVLYHGSIFFLDKYGCALRTLWFFQNHQNGSGNNWFSFQLNLLRRTKSQLWHQKNIGYHIDDTWNSDKLD